MTQEELSRLRELCEAATAGPWEAHVATRFEGTEQERGVVGPNGENVICWVVDEFEQSTENDVFIAAARTVLPQLLDEIERLQEADQELFDAGNMIVKQGSIIYRLEEQERNWYALLTEACEVLNGYPLDGFHLDHEHQSWDTDARQPFLQKARAVLKGEVND